LWHSPRRAAVEVHRNGRSYEGRLVSWSRSFLHVGAPLNGSSPVWPFQIAAFEQRGRIEIQARGRRAEPVETWQDLDAYWHFCRSTSGAPRDTPVGGLRNIDVDMRLKGLVPPSSEKTRQEGQ
jgi:hypothetical protein